MHHNTIESTSKPSQTQLTHLLSLAKRCQQHDNYIADIYPNLLSQQASSKSLFLAYHQQQLVGFLKVYFFYEHDAEVVLLIEPKHRRQGLATSLLNHAKHLLKQAKIKNLLFSYQDSSCQWLSSKGAEFQYSELTYQHHLNHPSNTALAPQPYLASQSDIKNIMALDSAGFDGNHLTAARVQQLLQQPNYQIWLLKDKDRPCAKLHLNLADQSAEIYDVAVHPNHRKQGLAKKLVQHTLAIAKNHGCQQVQLIVKSTNKAAINLYHSCGFEVCQSHHFWHIMCFK